MDVALGGQGAPLVPIGDELLFAEYDYCINIGGFANLSFKENNQRIAYDIGPANIILNYLAQELGADYDHDGEMGSKGNLDKKLLHQLNSIPYYELKHPKSLGKEWLDDTFIPILHNSEISINDQLTTVYHHIAHQIAKAIHSNNTKVLITGGGAYNQYLIDLIRKQTQAHVIIPYNTIIDFKEALIFAFLGLLRFENKVNCLSTVTGAKKDSSSGTIHLV